MFFLPESRALSYLRNIPKHAPATNKFLSSHWIIKCAAASTAGIADFILSFIFCVLPLSLCVVLW